MVNSTSSKNLLKKRGIILDMNVSYATSIQRAIIPRPPEPPVFRNNNNHLLPWHQNDNSGQLAQQNLITPQSISSARNPNLIPPPPQRHQSDQQRFQQFSFQNSWIQR